MSRRLPYLALLFASWLATANLLFAQRVQFPTAAPTFSPPASSPPVLPSFDPYGNPLLGTPPAEIPYNVTPPPGIGVPAGQPAPQFGQSVVPQQMGQPVLPPGANVPQSGASLFPNGLPFQYEQGAYQYQNPDGSVTRLQRFLQQISWEQTYMYGESGKADHLGVNRTELAATFGFPIFYNPDTPLLITPGFAFNWLQGPYTPVVGAADLPPRVYDAYLDAAWHPRLTDWWHADLGFRTGVWSDFENTGSDSVRFMGRGVGVLAFSPHFDLLLGVWYLDRNRVKLLPAGGVHWRPGGLWDFYLVFPNPKIRRRSINMGTSQWWMYFAGEYGGGRWTVKRLVGDDDIDYNDIRLIFGLEWETQRQLRGHLEIGYVLDRELLFTANREDSIKLDDTFMIRAGLDF